MGVLGDHDCESALFWLIFGLEAKSCMSKGCILEHHEVGVQMKRGGLWVLSSAWYEKGMMRKSCKNALRVFKEIKDTACVHCFG